MDQLDIWSLLVAEETDSQTEEESEVKPCAKCGARDRYPSGGCRPCSRAQRRARVNKPCRKCGARDRAPSGHCRQCKKARGRSQVNKPCRKCGARDRYPSGGCRQCHRAQRRARANKPCRKCGTRDRYPSGHCRQCNMAQGRARANKPCRKCGARDKNASGHCRPCHRAQRRARANKPCRKCGARDKNASGHCRQCKRIRSYGITNAQFAEIKDQQGGTCANTICGAADGLCVDHCHETGEVRGLLCSNCNTALGLLGDQAHLLPTFAPIHDRRFVKRALGFIPLVPTGTGQTS